MTGSITIDGQAMSVEQVVAVAKDYARVDIAPAARERLASARRVVEAAAASPEAVYGINTGFGKLASVRISRDELAQLQRNLIRSHAAGMGDPLPSDVVRAAMVLRVNVLLKPTSGVRPDVPDRLTALLNARIHPVVPEQGSVGASGDLAPLAHVALALLGEGDVDVVPHDGRRAAGIRMTAAQALEQAGVAPLEFGAKEGLAFINGTQIQSAVLVLLVDEAQRLWRNAHAAAALSLEALKGTPEPFDPRLHEVRPHPGQVESAALLWGLLQRSEIRDSHRTNDVRVQDAYSLRCTPQILGAVKDALDHATRVIEIEINAATDNPLVFGDDILSGGNFHGQPVALAADVAAIALTTLAGISERRLERILNPDLSPGLPAFLAVHAGLESGFMMLQIGAAALVGECRTLCSPASVQSITTDANQEDVVPMSMAAVMKARRILQNARRVVACELISGAQGLEHHRPLQSSAAVEAIYRRVRQVVAPLTADRPLSRDIETVAALLADEALI